MSMNWLKWIILCITLYMVKLVVASPVNCAEHYSTVSNKTNTDTLYLKNGVNIIGDYDYETRNVVVLYHTSTGKRSRVKKKDIDKLVTAGGKEHWYESKEKRELTNLQKFGIVIGVLAGGFLLFLAGFILLLYLIYPF